MKSILKSALTLLNNLISVYQVSLLGEKKALSTFLFHGLYNNENEIRLNHVAPQQSVTVEIFKEFIEYFLDHNYQFISPNDVIEGLNPNKKYALITFDDGYYNNIYALPVLEKFKVPAVFFISTDHIIENKCFWWDVIYRERLRQGVVAESIENEIRSLKKFKNFQIEEYISKEFGSNAFNPIGDIDRPFSPSELKQFSGNEFVFIGNHTSCHAILTNYARNEIFEQINGSQKVLKDIIGYEPQIIAYPNGNFVTDMIPIIKECGIKLGVTVFKGKNYFPVELDTDQAFMLKRYTLWGNRDLKNQFDLFRSDIDILKTLKKLKYHFTN